MLSSVLIANRGEIAVRIIRTARSIGLRTIAVYSEEDADALHVHMADQAYCIGPAPAAESYLRIDRILDVARASGADCIHPGYGFLSERAEFAEACAAAGIVFVGPPASAIRAMGLKDAAKALMQRSGVPVVPGYHGEMQDDAFLRQKAYEIGYPLIIKAVAGGGGKGMRRVERHQDFPEALASCKREALSSFGDDRVLIERYIQAPRHIEIQVFADAHGNVVHLFERDCSLQRRHQKVIEEAPAPGITPSVRKAMGDAAVAAAKAVGYVGAGTVEFIVDASSGITENSFYFMEMNTRLQVEHPVTEAITGLDLVELQFRVANGESLPFSQDDLGEPQGHAVEARLYAEDPANGFLPQSGTLDQLAWPVQESWLRIDTGVEAGARISPYYDPMIAKVIVWGEDRRQALERMGEALRHTAVLGLRTNLGFLDNLVRFPSFIEGRFDTGLIDGNLDELLASLPQQAVDALAASLWLAVEQEREVERQARISDEGQSPWTLLRGFSLGGGRHARLHLQVNGKPGNIDIQWIGPSCILVSAEQTRVEEFMVDGGVFSARIQGTRISLPVHVSPGRICAQWHGQHLDIREVDLLNRDLGDSEGGAILRAPMSGKLVKLLVSEGEEVTRGSRVAVLEAMKMEHALVAGQAARVKSLGAREGDQIAEGHVVAVLEAIS